LLSVTTDQLVGPDYPIRPVKFFVEAALAQLSPGCWADRPT
jgi:hypothetical protein